MHWVASSRRPVTPTRSKFADGNPYGVSLLANHDNIRQFDDNTYAALDHLARRVVTVADRLGG